MLSSWRLFLGPCPIFNNYFCTKWSLDRARVAYCGLTFGELVPSSHLVLALEPFKAPSGSIISLRVTLHNSLGLEGTFFRMNVWELWLVFNMWTSAASCLAHSSVYSCCHGKSQYENLALLKLSVRMSFDFSSTDFKLKWFCVASLLVSPVTDHQICVRRLKRLAAERFLTTSRLMEQHLPPEIRTKTKNGWNVDLSYLNIYTSWWFQVNLHVVHNLISVSDTLYSAFVKFSTLANVVEQRTEKRAAQTATAAGTLLWSCDSSTPNSSRSLALTQTVLRQRNLDGGLLSSRGIFCSYSEASAAR